MIFKLDLNKETISTFKCKQNDNRTIELEIYNEGIPFDLTGYVLSLNGVNENGDAFTQSTDIAISGNSALIKLKKDFTRVKGIVNIEATITHSSYQVSTFNFQLEVKQGVLQSASNIVTGIAQDIIEVLNTKISEAIKVKDDTQKLIDGGGAITKGELNTVSELTIADNIADTDITKGSRFDAEKLRLIQSQLLGDLMWKLRNNLTCTFTFQGDSLTYGHDISSANKRNAPLDILPDGSQHIFTRASKTITESFSEAMNEIYPNKINVINRGYSGDYCSRSYTRWNKKHNGDITIFMLGTNDSRSTSCPYVGDVKEYIKWYEQLIIRELLWGKPVVLLKSPRTLHANDMRIQAFSLAVDNLGKKYNCPVIDINDFISSYHIDIWSDDTPENTNNIRTHFTGKGYEIIGKRLASLFVADGLYRKNSVASGSTLLIREQVDGIRYINNTLNLEVNKTYAPQERTEGKSIIARIGANGKIAYSFYSNQDDLYIIPTVYCYANKKFKMVLDFGVEQQRVNLTTKYIPVSDVGDIIPSFVD
ncbi:MAG: SGNH/GDSL hydrolase family protein, partial [Peptostreptococcaceae bacterium]